MKKIFIVFFIALCGYNTQGQQNIFLNRMDNKSLPDFEIKGQGNFNFDALKAFYASGKIDAQFNHYGDSNDKLFSVVLGFNKSVSNIDSVTTAKLIFPDLGVSNFYLHTQKLYAKSNFKDTVKAKLQYGTFADFSLRAVRQKEDIASDSLNFDLLNFTFGFLFRYELPNRTYPVSITAQAYFGVHNLPNEDAKAFMNFVKASGPVNYFTSFGTKISLDISQYKFYFDARHVDSDQGKGDRNFTGFQYSIGTAINSRIFSI